MKPRLRLCCIGDPANRAVQGGIRGARARGNSVTRKARLRIRRGRSGFFPQSKSLRPDSLVTQRTQAKNEGRREIGTLGSARSTIASVASEIGYSPRTLRRSLTASETSFKGLRQARRIDEALTLLAEANEGEGRLEVLISGCR